MSDMCNPSSCSHGLWHWQPPAKKVPLSCYIYLMIPASWRRDRTEEGLVAEQEADVVEERLGLAELLDGGLADRLDQHVNVVHSITVVLVPVGPDNPSSELISLLASF